MLGFVPQPNLQIYKSTDANPLYVGWVERSETQQKPNLMLVGLTQVIYIWRIGALLLGTTPYYG
jgi:hypothetical protein